MAFDRHDDGFIGGAGLDSVGARLFCFPVLFILKRSDLSKCFLHASSRDAHEQSQRLATHGLVIYFSFLKMQMTSRQESIL